MESVLEEHEPDDACDKPARHTTKYAKPGYPLIVEDTDNRGTECRSQAGPRGEHEMVDDARLLDAQHDRHDADCDSEYLAVVGQTLVALGTSHDLLVGVPNEGGRCEQQQ